MRYLCPDLSIMESRERKAIRLVPPMSTEVSHQHLAQASCSQVPAEGIDEVAFGIGL